MDAYILSYKNQNLATCVNLPAIILKYNPSSPIDLF
jgi:hypothetical protein